MKPSTTESTSNLMFNRFKIYTYTKKNILYFIELIYIYCLIFYQTVHSNPLSTFRSTLLVDTFIDSKKIQEYFVYFIIVMLKFNKTALYDKLLISTICYMDTFLCIIKKSRKWCKRLVDWPLICSQKYQLF